MFDELKVEGPKANPPGEAGEIGMRKPTNGWRPDESLNTPLGRISPSEGFCFFGSIPLENPPAMRDMVFKELSISRTVESPKLQS